MNQSLFLTLLLCFSPGLAYAGEVMFEGYYRIDLEKKPIGYYISRYEFDPKLHQFSCTTFQRAKLGDKIVQESLKAVSNDKFQPVSYQYTSQVNDQIKTIDATFKGDTMKTVTTDGKKSARTENSKLQKGTFLSSFLVYIMLQQKLKVNDAFKYSAVAEEDGNSYWGKAWLESKETRDSITLFRVLNEYKSEKFISSLAVISSADEPDHFAKGEVFGSDSTAKNIRTELVAKPLQATEGQLIPNKILVSLFGNLPGGKINMVSNPPVVTKTVVAAVGSAPAARPPPEASANKPMPMPTKTLTPEDK